MGSRQTENGARLLTLDAGPSAADAEALLEYGYAALEETHEAVIVSLEKVSPVSSILLSVLLRWRSRCAERGLSFEIKGHSRAFHDFARVHGVEALLNFREGPDTP